MANDLKHSALSPADEPMTVSYQPGYPDQYGQFLGGTEFINLAPFNGRLFGGVGYWEDQATGLPNPGKEAPGPQVVVLDSSHGKWRQDHAFNEIRNGKRRYLRVTALQVITFNNTREPSGKVVPLEKPKSYLVVGLDGQTAAGGNIFVRVGETKTKNGTVGTWVETPLPKGDWRLQSFRAFKAFRDPETGLDRIYAGVGAQKENLPGAIFSGYYDESLPGPVKIHWDSKPEFSGFAHRVMSFTEANNKLYFAAKPSLYERFKGGANPAWRECYKYPLADKPALNASFHSSGLRGLTCIDDPVQAGHSLILAAYEGVPGEIYRIDPSSGKATEELRAFQFMRSKWIQGRAKAEAASADNPRRFVLLAYNEMMKVDSPLGEVRLLPMLAHSMNNDEKNSAWFLSRKEDSVDSSGYNLHEVKPIGDSRKSCTDPALWSIRTFMVSPFLEDGGKVLYFGGYDAHHQIEKNTAWLYRGGVNVVMKPYGHQ